MNKRNRLLILGSAILMLIVGCRQTSPPTAEPTTLPVDSDWIKLEGGGIELWVPESYRGGDPSQDFEPILEELKGLGQGPQRMARFIERDPAAFALWAYDSADSEAAFLTSMNVTQEFAPNISLDAYMEALAQQFPIEFSVARQGALTLERYEAGQMEVDVKFREMHSKEMLYILRDGNTLWTVTFATGADQFDARRPEFEQSIQTFVVQSTE